MKQRQWNYLGSVREFKQERTITICDARRHDTAMSRTIEYALGIQLTHPF